MLAVRIGVWSGLLNMRPAFPFVRTRLVMVADVCPEVSCVRSCVLTSPLTSAASFTDMRF